MTAKRTTVSRDPALVALLATLPGYPGPVAILDAADRAWARAHGAIVGERAPVAPLHERATAARGRRAGGEGKKREGKTSS